MPVFLKISKALWLIAFIVAHLFLLETGKAYTYDVELSLDGHVISKLGVENFGEPRPKNARRTRASRVFILKLAEPITVLGNSSDPISTETEKNVTELQLIDVADKRRNTLHAKFLESALKRNTPVNITGQLLHAHTAWHIRPVLFIYQKIKKSE